MTRRSMRPAAITRQEKDNQHVKVVCALAFASGADTIALTHLVGDSNIAEQLKAAMAVARLFNLGCNVDICGQPSSNRAYAPCAHSRSADSS